MFLGQISDFQRPLFGWGGMEVGVAVGSGMGWVGGLEVMGL